MEKISGYRFFCAYARNPGLMPHPFNEKAYPEANLKCMGMFLSSVSERLKLVFGNDRFSLWLDSVVIVPEISYAQTFGLQKLMEKFGDGSGSIGQLIVAGHIVACGLAPFGFDSIVLELPQETAGLDTFLDHAFADSLKIISSAKPSEMLFKMKGNALISLQSILSKIALVEAATEAGKFASICKSVSRVGFAFCDCLEHPIISDFCDAIKARIDTNVAVLNPDLQEFFSRAAGFYLEISLRSHDGISWDTKKKNYETRLLLDLTHWNADFEIGNLKFPLSLHKFHSVQGSAIPMFIGQLHLKPEIGFF